MQKHIVCFSGGHSSALVAIEVVRKYGTDGVVLLNHDINSNVEDADIKRFKHEVASYLGLPITYANCLDIADVNKIPDQFDVTMIAKAFKVGNGSELCTNRLKTAPFYNWLKANANPDITTIYYGFDAKERDRIIRRSKALESMGYSSDYPLVNWQRTIYSSEEIGINRPGTYSTFARANCIGCLKAGKQHWYIVYCTRPDIWEKGKKAEAYIGYTIHPGESLESMESQFNAMKVAGIVPSELLPQQKFWAEVRKAVPGNYNYLQPNLFDMPCECVI